MAATTPAPNMPPSLRWFYRQLPSVRSQRKFRQLTRRFMERAYREGATMLNDAVPTFEWPDGTRASLHPTSPQDQDTPVLYAEGTSPAVAPGEETACSRCAETFRQGDDHSRTHVAQYTQENGRVFELAIHECPTCAPQYTDEEASAGAQAFIESVVSEMMNETPDFHKHILVKEAERG